jgi:hypothetical protein
VSSGGGGSVDWKRVGTVEDGPSFLFYFLFFIMLTSWTHSLLCPPMSTSVLLWALRVRFSVNSLLTGDLLELQKITAELVDLRFENIKYSLRALL